MHVHDHRTIEELRRSEQAEKNADRSKRLRIVILAIEGWTAPSIAMAVGLSRRICQRWVARYNAHGLEGLDDRRGQQPGVPLTDQQQEKFRERIAAGPTDTDFVCSLRGVTSRGFWPKSSASFAHFRACTGYYVNLATAISSPARNTVRPTRNWSKRSSCSGPPDAVRLPQHILANACASTGSFTKGAGRIRLRPARHQYAGLGGDWFTPDSRASDRVRIPVGDRSGLPGNRACRRSAQPATEYQDHQHIPEAILANDP